MKIRPTIPAAVATALAALLAPAAAAAADYVQAPGSTLAFASRYDGELFTGRFGRFETQLSFDPARPEEGRLDVTIDLASAATGNSDRDTTLRTSDFFDVARFAHARYTASGFRRLDDGQYVAEGTLELRGVRKPVTLTFQWSEGAQPVLTGRAVVRRLDFGVGGGDWADTGVIPNAVNVSTRVVFSQP